jgi:hypothetical protein
MVDVGKNFEKKQPLESKFGNLEITMLLHIEILDSKGRTTQFRACVFEISTTNGQMEKPVGVASTLINSSGCDRNKCPQNREHCHPAP